MEKKINLSIDEGKPFYTHEASINFSPTQFIFDFRCITPRVDPRSNEAPTINITHNVVMTDPYHATQVYELLGTMLKKYEKEFGKIQKSKALEKIEKRRKSQQNKPAETIAPNYFG